MSDDDGDLVGFFLVLVIVNGKIKHQWTAHGLPDHLKILELARAAVQVYKGNRDVHIRQCVSNWDSMKRS